jgi:hypothetical protein
LAFVPYSMPFSCMTFCVCVLAEIIRVAKHIKNSYVAFPKPRNHHELKLPKTLREVFGSHHVKSLN